MGYISPEIGRVLAKQLRQSQARVAERTQRSKERLSGRAPERTLPAEDLGCPRCKAHYPFGNDCPDCQVPLMPLCAMALEPAPPERWPWLKLLLALVLFFTPFVALTWFTFGVRF